MSDGDEVWSKRTRDVWFYLALGLSFASVVWLFWPYLTVMMFATVVVVVTWPLYQRVLRLCRGREVAASILTTVILFFAVFGPLSFVIALFVVQAEAVIATVSQMVQDGSAVTWAEDQLMLLRATLDTMPFIGEYMTPIGRRVA